MESKMHKVYWRPIRKSQIEINAWDSLLQEQNIVYEHATHSFKEFSLLYI